MSFNQFFAKVINNLANEFVTKRLAQSKTFQSFAIRTHLNVEKVKEGMKHGVEQVADGNFQTHAQRKMGIRAPPVGGVAGFFRAMGKEVRKDLGM